MKKLNLNKTLEIELMNAIIKCIITVSIVLISFASCEDDAFYFNKFATNDKNENKIMFSEERISIEVGEVKTLQVISLPSGKLCDFYRNGRLTSDSENIATVLASFSQKEKEKPFPRYDIVEIRGVAPGTVTIKLKNRSLECKLDVTVR